MTPIVLQQLKNMLINHEGYRQFPYTDTTGHLTIGIGRNLTDRGITHDEAVHLLEQDITYFTGKLYKELLWFASLDDARKIVLVNMCFNLGWNKFLTFKRMLAAIAKRDYNKAGIEMLDSRWATQIGQRAHELAKIMITGEL